MSEDTAELTAKITKLEADGAAYMRFVELADRNVRAARAQVSGKRQTAEEQEETHALLAQVMNALFALPPSPGTELLAALQLAHKALKDLHQEQCASRDYTNSFGMGARDCSCRAALSALSPWVAR